MEVKEIDPKDSPRAAAYELWMKAPNPMVTFFKTLDVTNLLTVSRKKNLKFNIRFFDMFSGIGGFRSGLEAAGGFECIGHCEIDPYPNKAYTAIFDTRGEYFCDDARTINPNTMPDFDLVCAGFPCQSFSVAGRRLGFEDTRGTLFFEVARLLKAKRPAFFLLENVVGLLSHYKNKNTANSRNGHSSKTLRTSFGDVEVAVPRDRKGEFEPQLLKKNQTGISQDIEEKILSMYAKGMTTSDIEEHIRDIYGIEVSDTTVSRITDKILPLAKEWQHRPLEAIFAVVFMDAIHYHVRSEGRIIKKAVYIAIGINLDGRKDVLGMWVGENESAKFWATVLNGLKNRGVEDIFIACTDNLTGFSSAIEAVFPKTEIQNCIIHQLRNSSKYVSYKDLKALMADLKAVYAAVVKKRH